MAQSIHMVKLLHVAHDPNGKKVLELHLGEVFKNLELNPLGVMANDGVHLYPWSVIERVDFKPVQRQLTKDEQEELALESSPAAPAEDTTVKKPPLEKPKRKRGRPKKSKRS